VGDALDRFRKSGKEVIAYAEDYDVANYFIACSADQITAPPVAGWNLIGLRLDLVFLKEALDNIGVSADVVAVSPYKTGGDALTRAEISPEHRENLNQILDRHYQTVLEKIARTRGKDESAIRSLIDRAPLLAEEALAKGLFDRISYLDDLQVDLAEDEPSSGGEIPTVKLITLSQADRRLLRSIRRRSGRAIGVISLKGRIVSGQSRRLPIPVPVPFFGNVQVGSDSLAVAFRRAERDSRIAAVVLYIDSRGGSSLASDLIWREAARLSRRKPLVVYMADSGASGAYYVATAADWIVSQPLTLTGSIGVFALKISLQNLYRRLGVHRMSVYRGARAGLFSEDMPMTDELREIIQEYVFDQYERFKTRVVEGRGIDDGKVVDIAEGRIWLGSQAEEVELVDELGDLETALEKAREMAGLPSDRWTPTVWIPGGGGGMLPRPFPQVESAGVAWFRQVGREWLWMADPFDVVIH
jgi:protease-4